MHKAIILSLLPMLCCGMTAAAPFIPTAGAPRRQLSPAPIDTTHAASHDLGEAVVSGLAGSTMRRNNPAPVTLISQADLQRRIGTNLIDLVARQPGVSQITTGAGISKPVIRGLGYNRLVVVNNGLRQEEQQWGDEHGVGIDEHAVGSVEILKGPASVMYGSDAMAGVLVFHPAPIAEEGTHGGDLTTEYQTSSGLLGLSGGATGRSGQCFYNARISGRLAHDYRAPGAGLVYGSSFREWAASGTAGLIGSWGTSRLTLSHYHFAPGIVEGEGQAGGKGYSLPLPFQRIGHTGLTSDTRFALGTGQGQVVVGYQQNDRGEYEESASKPGLHLLLRTLSYNANWQSGTLFSHTRLRTGLSGMYQRSANKGDEFLIPDYSLIDAGAFAALQHDRRLVSLSAGLRYDLRHIDSRSLTDDGAERFSAFTRNYRALTGSLGAVIHAGQAGDVRVNVSRGFRSPNLSELASNGVHEGTQHYELGNHDLRAEHSLQTDLGYEYLGRMIRFSIAAFLNDVDNFIFLRRDAAGAEIGGVPAYRFVQGHARLWGLEALLDLHPLRHLHFENAFSLVKTHLLHQPAGARTLPLTPAPRLRSEVRYDFIHNRAPRRTGIGNLWASLSIDANWRQSDCFTAGDTEWPTAGYALLGAGLGADLMHKGQKRCSLVVSGDNLTDKHYFNHLSRLKYAGEGVPNPGRNVSLKFIWYWGQH